MTVGFLTGPTVANITDTTVSVSGLVATYTLPVWSTIPDQSDDALSLPLTLDLTAYVTSQTPITAWGTDVGTVDANGLLTIPAGTLAGANVITVSATNSAGQASATPFTWTVTYQEYFKDFSLSDNTDWTHTRGSIATMHDYLGNIVTVNGTDAHDGAFIGSEYTDLNTYVDHGVGYGIQLEDESTNVLGHTTDLSNWKWNANGDVVVTNHATIPAPDGTMTAQHVTGTSAGGGFLWQSSVAPNNAADHGAMWARAVSGTGNAVIISTNAAAPFVAQLTEQWQRFSAPMRVDNTSYYVVDFRVSENELEELLVWNPQCELNRAFSSSDILNSTSGTATRAATSLTAPFSALSPLPAGGVVNDFCFQVIVWWKDGFDAAPDWSHIFGIGDLVNGVRLAVQNDGTVDLIKVVDSAQTAVPLGSTFGKMTDFRVRLDSTSGIKVWVDGTPYTNADAAPFDAPASLVQIGSRAGVAATNEHCIHTRIVPAALDDIAIIGDPDDLEAFPGWPTWEEPLPIITQNPTDIDFGGEGPTEPPTEGLIQPEHITYIGSFEVPKIGGNGGPNDAGRSGNCMAATDNGTALFIGTRMFLDGANRARKGIGKISIPEVGGQATWLIDSQQIQYDKSYGHDYTSTNEYPRAGFVYNNRLILSTNIYYDNHYNEGYTHVAVDLDLVSNWVPDQTADYAAYGVGKPYTTGFMFAIPPEWQEAFGGPCLLGGATQSIAESYPPGFSLFVFDPDKIGVEEPFPITAAYYNRHQDQTWLAARTYTGTRCDGVTDDWIGCAPNTWWQGGSVDINGGCWPAGTSTILFVGHIGIGEPTYKCAIGCDDGTGGGADPYQRQIWAFDANDVLKSLNGEEARHFPTPYRTWVLPEPGAEGDCTDSQAGAFAYDETTRRIYYAKQYEEDPVIHVLEVAELI